MTRITAEMTLMDSIVEMCEGNPGALRVLMGIMKNTETIDPDNALGGLGTVLMLDTFGIYGSRIWMLYKDVCGESIANTIGVLRAVQLGLVSQATMDQAINNQGAGLDVYATVQKVKAELPRFGA